MTTFHANQASPHTGRALMPQRKKPFPGNPFLGSACTRAIKREEWGAFALPGATPALRGQARKGGGILLQGILAGKKGPASSKKYRDLGNESSLLGTGAERQGPKSGGEHAIDREASPKVRPRGKWNEIGYRRPSRKRGRINETAPKM